MIEQFLGDDVESSGQYLAEVIYGANDGIVTTFAVVSGVAGAALNPSIVLILGAANLFADGFSMGMSNYLSRQSELDYQRSVRKDGRDPPEELADGKSPIRTAFVTFLAFVIAGWAPLLPYILEVRPTFPLSIAFTGFAFFAVGASRSLVTSRRWFVNGAEMFVVGMAAAIVAYTVGNLLGGLA
ncbi:VIT1/CCC1 transporter family protein [Halobellus sp. H-GB7]|jgi:VIT1/CCC1 family predicted Fe2+/Mn2+ transporter|uniref:VIT1/CCC1 transporter family protein n=1 Tax=Halobellus sp. H-GB7 TaxID=3069756 RepID=UPI0027B67C1A|nr:VIT1/CCC1 transporter family protein [Halobellus sp. H-GB7]MDQ2055977.1 VIT1/CCC1 transporter family protein [Halobellus sp. H-GB7]